MNRPILSPDCYPIVSMLYFMSFYLAKTKLAFSELQSPRNWCINIKYLFGDMFWNNCWLMYAPETFEVHISKIKQAYHHIHRQNLIIIWTYEEPDEAHGDWWGIPAGQAGETVGAKPGKCGPELVICDMPAGENTLGNPPWRVPLEENCITYSINHLKTYAGIALYIIW